MNWTLPPDFEDEDFSTDGELRILFEITARHLVDDPDPRAYLDWIETAGPVLAPSLAAAVDPRAGPPGQLFRALGVSFYNATPRPDAGYALDPIPEPGRNQPCSCGSGRKYKHCCLSLAGLLDLRDYNLLRHVLDVLPKRVFAELPASRVNVDAVADTVDQWLNEGEYKRALALLEPWFAGDGKLGDRLEPLFDLLMDVYYTLGNERKRERLLKKAVERGDKALRAAALQRRATILADRGEYEAAWATFGEAQRENPDDPSLSILEITLLVSRGETRQAQERARFWVSRLERFRNPGYEDLIETLRAVAEDPGKGLAGVGRDMHPGLNRLAELFEQAPPVESHYQLYGDDDAALVPDRKLANVESIWGGVFPQAKPMLVSVQSDAWEMWEDAQPWLALLEETPLAWQSFDVLDDLAMAVEALSIMGTDTTLLEPLLDRGIALLERNLFAAGRKGSRLPWGFMENRPALRLLAHRAFRLLEREEDDTIDGSFVDLAERLIALNPMDNHGIRDHLARAYLKKDEPEKALALSEQYPDDFCAMTLNRMLALYRLGRRDEALQLLHETGARHAVAIKMLLAKNPKPPRHSEYGMQVGGKEEAWEYRAAHRALWQRDDALEWLRKGWRSVKKQSG